MHHCNRKKPSSFLYLFLSLYLKESIDLNKSIDLEESDDLLELIQITCCSRTSCHS